MKAGGIDPDRLYDLAEEGHAEDIAAICAWIRARPTAGPGTGFAVHNERLATAIERGDWKKP